MKSKISALLICFAAVSCIDHAGIDSGLLKKQFDTPDGISSSLKTASGAKGTVLVFYSPECPLCINYTKTIKDIRNQYDAQGIGFVLIFPGTFYSADTIRAFMTEYDFDLPALLDPNHTITNSVNATVTPEVVLIDPAGEVKYRGAIDDWSYETGKKKRYASNHYLSDALTQMLGGKNPDPSETESIGCFIE